MLEYDAVVIALVPIDDVPLAISTLTIVPVAPPESVMVTVSEEKSGASSNMISSPASAELEFVPSSSRFPLSASSSPSSLLPAFACDASLPLSAIKLPVFSPISLSPTFAVASSKRRRISPNLPRSKVLSVLIESFSSTVTGVVGDCSSKNPSPGPSTLED